MERFFADPFGILIDSVVLGLFDAGPLALAAIGFTLIYYLSGFLNVAYGENLIVGAYAAIVLNTGVLLPFSINLNFYLTIVPAAIIAGAFSVLTYLLIFRPAMRRGVGPTEMIILSVGLSFAIRFSLRIAFGPRNKNFDLGQPIYLEVFGIGVTDYQLAALALAAAFMVGLYLFVFRTDYGQKMRALASNPDLSAVSGIDPVRVSILIWFIAGVAGGLAGIFYGVFSSVNTDIGWELILIVIMITIVGRVGSVRGATIAAVGAAVFVAFMTQLTQPLYGQIALLFIFIVILKFSHVRTMART
ncbi:MAG: branched-chain amino acid ABC transporter permease [Chloroflexota bacterium]